jgi:tetratricopeptide (TPR) repeat protein
MPRPAEPARSSVSRTPDGSGGSGRTPGDLLGAIGLTSLLAITVTTPGATRMYAWPWSLGYAAALLAPALQLLWRAFQRRRPLALPSLGWCAVLLAASAGTVASALASPYRGASVLWSAPLLAGIATFFVVFDWVHADAAAVSARRNQLLTGAGIFLAVVAGASMGLWLWNLPSFGGGNIFATRNPFPLGHANYTAGLALLALPCFLALALRDRGARLIAWSFAALLAMAMLLTSGSRGGFLGLAALALLHGRTIARGLRVRVSVVFLGGMLVLAALVAWNPRLRAALAGDELKLSDVQRSAMLHAGWRMGADRPLLGWGPGTTPLVYPRYRAMLEGGAENVLQLHSTPAQLWGELGGVNVFAALALLILAIRAARASAGGAGVLLALGGYAIFSLTDWQLDVPIFAGAVAAALALLAPAAPLTAAEPRIISLFKLGGRSWSVRWREDAPALRRLLGIMTLLAFAVFAIWGRRDPTPPLNTRALDLALNPDKAGEAIALLRESLKLNGEQEIAHFNLGWLLVVNEPVEAEAHFNAAARLVPDKGGVYFGLGLARLNQGRRDEAARAFALECLNDPAFLVSPWWRAEGMKVTRTNTLARLVQYQSLVLEALPVKSPLRSETLYARELALWLGTGAPVTHPNTAARIAYFEKKPSPPAFETAAITTYRRERTGYPVLMRDLDLPTPVDLFDVQENPLALGEYHFLFPAKGWLASPLLPALLLESDSRPK